MHRLQRRLPEAARGGEREQVQHREPRSEQGDEPERGAEVLGAELARHQTSCHGAETLGETPEAHRQAPVSWRHEVADDREPDRGDRSQPDGGEDLPSEQFAVALGAGAEVGTERPHQGAGKQQTLAVGAIPPVPPGDSGEGRQQDHGGGHRPDGGLRGVERFRHREHHLGNGGDGGVVEGCQRHEYHDRDRDWAPPAPPSMDGGPSCRGIRRVTAASAASPLTMRSAAPGDAGCGATPR